MARSLRAVCTGASVAALLSLPACDGPTRLTPAQAAEAIREELPALIEASLGERRSVPAEVAVIGCASGRQVAERHARVAELRLDDDPDAIADAAQAHLEERGADVESVQLLPQAPRVEATKDGVGYVLLVDTETRRVTAAGTTSCYTPE